MCTLDLGTGEAKAWFEPKLLKDYLVNFDKFIGHNIIEFDAPQLQRLWDVELPQDDIIDTLILSRLYSPKLIDGHSLDAWGKRLGSKKIEFSDFSQFSEEMVTYCIQDTRLTGMVYNHLMGKKLSVHAVEIEHKLAQALLKSKQHGFFFNLPVAMDLKKDLEALRDGMDTIIQAAYPPTLKGKRVIKEVPFNPNSAKQVIDKLWEAGWRPQERTEGHKLNTDPLKKDRYERYGWKINENNLATLPDSAPDAAKSILKRTIIETRVRKLDEWIELVGEDGAIHGDIISLGTWTHRMAHRNPNLGNISAKKSIKYHTEELKELATDLGAQMRALWMARPGKVLVGTDAEGIQLRVLAHYIDDKEFTEAVTKGNKEDGTDPHSFNQKRIGRGSRDNAKTFIYAFLLGAGDAKIGEIYNISKNEGRDLKATFIDAIPGLKRVKGERIPVEARNGYTIGFDGRSIICNSEHHMMAAYLQGGETVVVKLAVVLALKELASVKIAANLINIVHDEMIFECDKEDAEQVRKITEQSIADAGTMLKLKCPMKGEGKIGRTWLDVH